MQKEYVSVGIIGFGTVGTGTAKILLQNASVLSRRLGFDIRLKRIADLDIKRDRGIALPEGVLIPDASALLDDPEIDIVVELVGGINPAKRFILDAIKRGKHVVTANKALLATEGNEIFAEAEKHRVQVGFEAAVAGGIPIIKVISEGLVANRISSVYGIINGTSNYILTKMSDEGVEFKDALAEAQRLGYAEADPTFDIEGVDSAHKLAILASLAYGMPLSLGEIYREGITRITSMDIEFARELGYRVKLLAIAKSEDDVVELRVHPTMLPEWHLMSKVDGVFNAIHVKGDAVGDTLYYGRGAGDMPTGSAVVSDIADIAGGIMRNSVKVARVKESAVSVKKMEDIRAMYYFRFTAIDRPGVLSKIAGVLGSHNIGIASVIQKGRKQGEAVPVIVLTHQAQEFDILAAVKEIDAMPVVSERTFFIRVEGREED